MKCEICGKEILRDSQCINYKYYHNDCLENLEKQNKQLKSYTTRKLNNLNSILTKLEEWLKETRINSAFIDEQTIMEVQLKIQELKEKYK